MVKNKGGRPTIMTTETVNKLEEVFALGGTDEEACFYADISKQTLYSYQDKNPEFIDRKEALKQRPFLKARQTIVKNLDTLQGATWYMERKKKNEFALRTEVTGRDGGAIVFMPTEVINKINDNPTPEAIGDNQ